STLPNGSHDLYILGVKHEGPEALLKGAIDEFGFYKRALSAQEILSHARLIRDRTYFWYVRITGSGQTDSPVTSQLAGSFGALYVPPAVQLNRALDGTVVLSWAAYAGRTYRVQYKTD